MEAPPWTPGPGAESMFPLGLGQPHQGNGAASVPVLLPPPIPSYEQMCNSSSKGTPAISRSILRALGLDDNAHNEHGEEVSIQAVMGGMKRRKKSPRAPKRPLSAYNLFFRDQRARVRDEGLSDHKTFEALGKFVAEQWKKLPFAEKQRYEDLEEEDRRRYHAEMAVFNEALELGIVHELPGSGAVVKDAGSERHVKPKAAGSIEPVMPQWVSEKAAQVSDPPLVPSVGQDGAVGDDNTFAAPGNTPWAETPTSRSCVANPESAQNLACGGESSTERSPMELAVSWRYDEQSDVEQHAWPEGQHEEIDYYTLDKETGGSRSGLDLSNAVSLDPPRSLSSSPCWPALNLSVAQEPQAGGGDELEQALRRYVEILQQSVQLANLRQQGAPEVSAPHPNHQAPWPTHATLLSMEASRPPPVPHAVPLTGLAPAAVSSPVPPFVATADALQEQLLIQLHMLQEQSRRQQEIQRLTPTQETPQQQEADER